MKFIGHVSDRFSDLGPVLINGFSGWRKKRTGTVRTVLPGTMGDTGTAGTVFQELKPGPSVSDKLY